MAACWSNWSAEYAAARCADEPPVPRASHPGLSLPVSSKLGQTDRRIDAGSPML